MRDLREDPHQFVDNLVPGQSICRKCGLPRRVIPESRRIHKPQMGPVLYRNFHGKPQGVEFDYEYLVDNEWLNYDRMLRAGAYCYERQRAAID